jgi:hypothetical protein
LKISLALTLFCVIVSDVAIFFMVKCRSLVSGMSSINLPWESENIVEFTKSQLIVDSATTPVITTLISSLKIPTQFALIITLDEEKPAEPAGSNQGFFSKVKTMASNAATQAVSVKRQVTAGCNKLAAVYDVKFVIPVAMNVDFSITAGSLICTWTEVPSGHGDFVKRQIRLNNLSNKFVNAFNAAKEISINKEKHLLVLNGQSQKFSWLWKYQPICPVTDINDGLGQTLSSSAIEISGRILCLTWNVAGLPPPDDNPLNVLPSSYSKYKTGFISFLRKHPEIDIVILALQEASPLNAKTVLFKSADDNFGEAWMDWFNDVLNCSGSKVGRSDWVKTVGIVQVGLAVAMFVNKEREDSVQVTAPMTSSVKTGTLGLTGNKGCVGLRSRVSFQNYGQVGISVLNVHLASGEGKADFRKTELMKVANESSFMEDKSVHFFDAEFCIVTGDLNSRVNEEGGDVDGMEIPPDDELLTRMREEAEGFMFSEREVRFPATYKLVPGEEGRLVFHMNRRPGWCDRVLFRSAPLNIEGENVKFHCLEYNSLRDIDHSDHTPVYAVFALGKSPQSDSKMTMNDVKAPIVATKEIDPEFKINDSVNEDDDDENDSDLYDN